MSILSVHKVTEISQTGNPMIKHLITKIGIRPMITITILSGLTVLYSAVEMESSLIVINSTMPFGARCELGITG